MGRDARVVLGLFLFGVLLRVPGLGSGFWIDEIASLVNFMRLPVPDIFTTYVSANNHVFYSVLAKFSMAIFGESEWAARLPAMLFGAATVPALFLLARTALDRREAVAAALILACSYHHAYFSQNARGYTAMVFLAVVTTALLRRALEHNERRAWTGWAIASALNVYLLLSGVFVCIGQVIGALVLRRDRFKPLALWTSVAAGITIALYAPLFASMFEFYGTADRNVGWSPAELLKIIVRDAAPHPLVAVAAVLALPVLVIGAVSLAKRLPLVFFGLLLPPVIEMTVALVMGVGTYPRRFLLLAPFVLLVAVRGCAVLTERLAARWAPARKAFIVMILGGMIVASMGLTRLYAMPKQDYRGALDVVAGKKREDDIVAAAYTTTTGTQYYDASVLSARTEAELRELLARGRRIWLLGTFLDDMKARAPGLEALIAERFDFVARRNGLVGDGDVVVWVSR